jgi:hypothetical protein
MMEMSTNSLANITVSGLSAWFHTRKRAAADTADNTASTTTTSKMTLMV